jgi:hypothetical protein
LDVINQLCPVKRRRIKGISADWITVEVLLSIKNRNQAKNQFDSDPTTTNKMWFNNLRNECKLTVDKAKRDYYLTQFQNSDSTTIWETYSKIMGKDVKV